MTVNLNHLPPLGDTAQEEQEKTAPQPRPNLLGADANPQFRPLTRTRARNAERSRRLDRGSRAGSAVGSRLVSTRPTLPRNPLSSPWCLTIPVGGEGSARGE
jgi:hypothetical protein